MKITIGFSKPKNHKFPIFSWLIRLFEKTKYSHVYVKWYASGPDVHILYEAGGSSVRFLGEKVHKTHTSTVHEYVTEIDKETYKKLLKFCMENAGVNYGVKQVIGTALVKLFKLNKNPFSDGRKSQVCSELIGTILTEVLGKDLKLDLDIAGPRDIKEFLDTQTDFTQLF